MNRSSHISSGLRTLAIEAQAIQETATRLDQHFEQAVELILACQGRVVVCGIGKSGHIGKKIAATFASTGTPAFFMHAAEAIHGDLGMITPLDLMIAISYSGSGAEFTTVVPAIKRLGATLIAITGNPESELAKHATVHLNGQVSLEACPLNLAPTASSTVALALGDALAIACLQARGFKHEDFARSHPGGSLGRRLLTHVSDLMRTGDAIPIVYEDAPIVDALIEISRKGMGMTCVLDQQQQLKGIFTDGDLRRLIEKTGDIRQLTVRDGMSLKPLSITPNELAAQAAALLDEHKKNVLVVCDDTGQLVGALHTHDLMAAKVI